MLKKEPMLMVLCLAADGFIAELGVCFELLSPANFKLALSIHIVTVALLTLWTFYLSRRHDFRFSLLLVLGTVVMGPFGAAVGFLAIIVYKLSTSSSVDPLEWMDNFFLPQKISLSERLRERLDSDLKRSAPAISTPYQDILTNGTILQKQMTIAKITRYFRSQFAPLLLQAARNPEPAVRVQAATALAKINRDFMTRYMRLENELKDIPDSHERRIKLAQLYDDYAFAGLTDEESRHSMRSKAIKIYEAHVTQSNDQGLIVRLARLYLRQDQPEKASQLLGPVAMSGDTTLATASWYMEALFCQRRLKELRQFARAYAATHEKQNAFNPIQGLGEMFQIWNKENNTSGLVREK